MTPGRNGVRGGRRGGAGSYGDCAGRRDACIPCTEWLVRLVRLVRLVPDRHPVVACSAAKCSPTGSAVANVGSSAPAWSVPESVACRSAADS